MIDVADLRRSYTMSGLDEKDLPELSFTAILTAEIN